MSDQVVWASMAPGEGAVTARRAGAGWSGIGSGGCVPAGAPAGDGLDADELDGIEEDLDEDENDDELDDEDDDDDDDDLDEFEDDELDDEDDDEDDEINFTEDRYSRISRTDDHVG